jgi:hypothetical protein
MVATDTADNKCEAIVAIEAPVARCRVAHKSAPSFTVIGGRCKEVLFKVENSNSSRSLINQRRGETTSKLIPESAEQSKRVERF